MDAPAHTVASTQVLGGHTVRCSFKQPTSGLFIAKHPAAGQVSSEVEMWRKCADDGHSDAIARLARSREEYDDGKKSCGILRKNLAQFTEPSKAMPAGVPGNDHPICQPATEGYPVAECSAFDHMPGKDGTENGRRKGHRD